MDYSNKDMELIVDWNKYFENIVNMSDIPLRVKRKMLNERVLHNGSNFYYMNFGGYTVEFMKLEQWILQTQREEKLKQLGI